VTLSNADLGVIEFDVGSGAHLVLENNDLRGKLLLPYQQATTLFAVNNGISDTVLFNLVGPTAVQAAHPWTSFNNRQTNITTGVVAANFVDGTGDTNAAGALVSTVAFTPATGAIGFNGVTPAVLSAAYTATNVTTDRTYDANVTTLDEVADVLGTLIADLKARGVVG